MHVRLINVHALKRRYTKNKKVKQALIVKKRMVDERISFEKHFRKKQKRNKGNNRGSCVLLTLIQRILWLLEVYRTLPTVYGRHGTDGKGQH